MRTSQSDRSTGTERRSSGAIAERAVLPFPPPVTGDLAPAHETSALWRTLRKAGDDVCAAMHQGGEQGADAAFDVEATVAVLCAATRQIVRGREPRLRSLPPAVPVRRCVDLLRRGFVREVRQAGVEADRDAVLDVLAAMERLAELQEQDCAQRLADQLSGPDAADLVSEVAHDMRSPLGSILFLVETLRKERSGPVNPVQDRQLGIVYNAAFGLANLASDLTEMAQGCERLLDVRPAPFSMAELFRGVVDIVQPMAEEKGLTVTTSASDTGVRLGRASALHRVLLNLATNALKFTNLGGVELVVASETRTRLRFSVNDTGRGIPSEVMATLFDAFRRHQRGRLVFSSAGLGLGICRKLVESMGGALEVSARPSGGTSFSFALELPVASRISSPNATC